GNVYGLTVLSPILQDPNAETSHNCAIRMNLAGLPRDESSPFARVSSTHMARMAGEIPTEVDGIWQHCWGYPGLQDVGAFISYMKMCQITTTFYFADVNNKTVQQTLRALQTQAAVAEFIENNQGRGPAALQKSFADFLQRLRNAPPPIPGRPGTGGPPRIETRMKWATKN